MTEWRELGGLGRVALVGVVLSGGVAVALGFSIPAAVRAHLLEARGDLVERIAEDMTARGLIPLEDPSDGELLASLDEAVRRRLLGGETIRVKVWNVDGTILYSDMAPLIGQSFALGDQALRALSTGETSVEIPDLTAPENVHELNMGRLIEFYVPVPDASGRSVALFEVYQRADGLDQALSGIRRDVWVSIGTGLGALSLFMGSLTIATARTLRKRHRHAEKLLGALLRAQDEERRRIVGALHDDVGQPIYRLIYGLEGCRSRLPPDAEVNIELARLQELVRQVDGTLRGELRLLHQDLSEDLGLERALAELVEMTRRETDLAVDLLVDGGPELYPVPRSALLRAAQEALTNVRKHAGARRVSVRLHRRGGRVLLQVEDDGGGWGGAEGLGLATTRERLEAIDGGLIIQGRNGGTTVRAWVPAGEQR